MLKIVNVNKKFGEKTVLLNINMEVADGEVYGLVGANGAGKTTFMSILAQVLTPDSGEVWVDGKRIRNMNDLAGNIGFVVDIPAMFEYMTAHEYLTFLMRGQNFTKEEEKAKITQLLNAVGLRDIDKKRIKSFSRGMKQRMGIASGLVSNPKVVLLDEPSSALDPEGRVDVIGIIDSLRKQGKIVVLSTHILADVDRVCDRVGLVVRGNLVIEGKLEEVLEKYTKPIICVESKEPEAIIKAVKRLSSFVSATLVNGGAEIECKPGKVDAMFKKIIGLGLPLRGIYVKRPTIEEVFIQANREVRE